jgi:hypothetical protein
MGERCVTFKFGEKPDQLGSLSARLVDAFGLSKGYLAEG